MNADYKRSVIARAIQEGKCYGVSEEEIRTVFAPRETPPEEIRRAIRNGLPYKLMETSEDQMRSFAVDIGAIASCDPSGRRWTFLPDDRR